MPLVLPPARNYQQPMNSVPALFGSDPPEGPRLVPIDINWQTMGGPNQCVSVNLYGGAPATISQIVALSVDNSGCAADVQFLFPDTGQTYTVPAYQPNATFPVFTNSTQIYVLAIGSVGAADDTRFAILNTMPPPVALPLSSPQLSAIFNNIPVASGTTAILPPAVNGRIEAMTVSFQFVATACNVQWILEDSETPTPKILAGGQAAASPIANDNLFYLAYSQSNLNIRFFGGVNFAMTITGSGTGATATVNVYYRSP
jgi:hypothetical protein